MKKLTITLAATVVTLLSGCSSTTPLKKQAKDYSQTKAIYCGSSSVVNYINLDDIIAISCSDGSSKTIFLEG